MKVKNEKTMLRVCCVKKLFTRLWSPIRCIKSPINFVSKNDIGSFKSLIKKSLTNEMLMRIEIWRSNQRRIKSIAVWLIVKTNCPKSINHINPMFWFLIPTSTIACVRKGKINCNKLPTSNPKTTCRNSGDRFLYNQRGT